MTFDRKQSAGYAINYVARLFADALQRRIREHGVAIGQFPILLMLWESEGATQTQLAKSLAVEQPTVANTLKRMMRDGLIERVPDPDDRRQVRIYLTARGRALEPLLTASAEETNEAALAGFTAEERQRFLALVWKAVQNLERDSGTEP